MKYNAEWLEYLDSVLEGSCNIYNVNHNLEPVAEYKKLSLLWHILKNIEFTWKQYDDSNRIIDVVDMRSSYLKSDDIYSVTLYEILIVLCIKVSQNEHNNTNLVYYYMIKLLKELYIYNGTPIYTNSNPPYFGIMDTVDYVKRIQEYFTNPTESLWEIINFKVIEPL